MGKIIYEPKKNSKVKEEAVEHVHTLNMQQEEERYNALIENIDSVKPVGDTDCDYTIYLEDYAYTYIYQYASTDLSCEHSAAIIGEYYPENNEIIVCGIMPVRKDKLNHTEEWVNEAALEEIYAETEKYFPGAMVLGWLHMQPGYGTMLTMKEVKVQRDLFNRQGSVLLLVDPVNKIETFYVYEDEQLIEQTGYYIYYDKNANMQQYMLDKPFVAEEKEEVDDGVVTQFREIGRIRKKEYQQRKKTNFTVVAAGVALLAMTAVVVRIGNQPKEIDALKNQIQALEDANRKLSSVQTLNPPTVVIGDQASSGENQGATQVGVGDVEIIDNTKNAVSEVEAEEAGTEPDVEIISVPKEDTEMSKEEIEVIDGDKAEEVENDPAVEETVAEATVEEEVEDTPEIAVQDYKVYVVQEGDSLRSISYDHYQTESRTKDIIALNDIQNGDVIYVGEELKIPVE